MQNRLTLDQIQSQRGHVPGLDGLRACSIGLVLISHFFFPRGAAGWGAMGVWIFFCLSGFLITRLMFAEFKDTGRIDVPTFYARRFLRLYPVVAVYLLVASLFSLAKGLPAPLIEICSVLFYFLNYLLASIATGQIGAGGAQIYLPVGVLWSLSVEEHFYILMPLVFVAARGSVRKLAAYAMAITVGCLALRYFYVLTWPDVIDKLVTYVRSDMRFDSIASGVLLALACESKARHRIIAILSSRPAFAIGCLMMVGSLAVRDPIFKETLRFTIRNLAAVPIIAGVVFGNLGFVQTVLNSRPLAWMGRISYSLYIWHGGVEYFLLHSGIDFHSLLLNGLAYTVSAFILATASYYLLEMPVLEWRRRLERTRKDSTSEPVLEVPLTDGSPVSPA